MQKSCLLKYKGVSPCRCNINLVPSFGISLFKLKIITFN